MTMPNFEERIHELYHVKDYNCARTTLICLAEQFPVELHEQALNAAIGMHGAGRFRAQCGLVEGALMFIGIYGAQKGLSDKKVAKLCFLFAEAFTKRFGSLLCRELRPGGFQKTDPPHACEPLTVETMRFTIEFLENAFRV
jgi:C_GCAxxG_C_C family probable redox protein